MLIESKFWKSDAPLLKNAFAALFSAMAAIAAFFPPLVLVFF